MAGFDAFQTRNVGGERGPVPDSNSLLDDGNFAIRLLKALIDGGDFFSVRAERRNGISNFQGQSHTLQRSSLLGPQNGYDGFPYFAPSSAISAVSRATSGTSQNLDQN